MKILPLILICSFIACSTPNSVKSSGHSNTTLNSTRIDAQYESCYTHQGWQSRRKCIEKAETLIIDRFPRQIHRTEYVKSSPWTLKESALEIISTSGNKIRFTDDLPAESDAGYKYLLTEHYPEINYFGVIQAGSYCDFLIMISSQTGNKYELPPTSIFSPDQKRLVAYYLNMEPSCPAPVDMSFYVNIYRIYSDKMEKEWSLSLRGGVEWEPGHIGWLDNETIEIKESVHSSQKKSFLLRLVENQWTVEGSIPEGAKVIEQPKK